MKMIPDFSVLIPVYNGEAFLEESVMSALQQRDVSIEIVIVDDGSTDSTWNICKRIADEHSNVKIFHQDNQGVSCARNKALSMACGKRVLFLDADDTLDPFLASRAKKCMTDSNADCCYLSEDIFSKRFYNSEATSNEEFLKRLFGEHLSIPCWRLVYLLETIVSNDLCFEPGCTMGEDQEFAFKYLLTCSKVAILCGASYFYNRDKNINSATSTQQMNSFDYGHAMIRVSMFAQSKNYNDPKLIYEINARVIDAIVYAIENSLRAGEEPQKVATYIRESFSVPSRKQAKLYWRYLTKTSKFFILSWRLWNLFPIVVIQHKVGK